jgi:hypothetical protein
MTTASVAASNSFQPPRAAETFDEYDDDELLELANMPTQPFSQAGNPANSQPPKRVPRHDANYDDFDDELEDYMAYQDGDTRYPTFGPTHACIHL